MQARHSQLFKQIEEDMDKTNDLKQIPNLVEAILPYSSSIKGFIKGTIKLTFTSEESMREFYDLIKNIREVYNLVVFDRSDDRAAVEVRVVLDAANRGKNYSDVIQLLQKLFPAKIAGLEEKTAVTLSKS